ncbi:hypothetical protein V4C85_25125 [Ralstonia solanacearum]|uniref:hypothetical protein n=1 Tax=Ralstonia solanacearum TaxID=305 RepID=UPI002F91C3CB
MQTQLGQHHKSTALSPYKSQYPCSPLHTSRRILKKSFNWATIPNCVGRHRQARLLELRLLRAVGRFLRFQDVDLLGLDSDVALRRHHVAAFTLMSLPAGTYVVLPENVVPCVVVSDSVLRVVMVFFENQLLLPLNWCASSTSRVVCAALRLTLLPAVVAG